MRYVVEYLIGATGSYYAYRTISQDTAKDALVYIHRLYFIEIHLQRVAADEAGLDDDTMISDGKLI